MMPAQDSFSSRQNLPPVPPPPAIPQVVRRRRNPFITLFLVLVVSTGLGALGYSYRAGLLKNLPFLNRKTPAVVRPETVMHQWTNCNDVRDIIEEENSYYLACLGGVLHISRDGSVIDQITMTDGLGDNVTTSLAKKDNTLYIGTQDGITIYDLATKKAKKVSVPDGLTSGSNIVLELDGDDLWIATFNGVNRYDTKTGQITTFKEELAPNSSIYTANALLVTPKAVYVNVVANSFSAGSIARFDKTTGAWERYSTPFFGNPARLDFTFLAGAAGKIWTGDINHVWEMPDEAGGKWQDITGKLALGSAAESWRIFGDGKFMYMSVINKVYKINPADYSIVATIPARGLFVAHTGVGKVWTMDKWLSWVDTTASTSGTIMLQNRPVRVERVVGAVDGTALILADGDLWKVDPADFNPERIASGQAQDMDGSTPTLFSFLPIPDTDQIFIFSQSCGMTCTDPIFQIIGYKEKEVTELALPPAVLAAVRDTGPGYVELSFSKYDYSSNKIEFRVYPSRTLTFDVATRTWQLGTAPAATPTTSASVFRCNPSYTFASNGNKFTTPDCPDDVEFNGRHYEIKSENSEDRLFETTASGVSSTIAMPATASRYSPFGWEQNLKVNMYTVSQGKIWLATNKGLSYYDPANRSSRLFSSADGLLSHDVSGVVVTDIGMWAVTEWGGLSYIPHP